MEKFAHSIPVTYELCRDVQSPFHGSDGAAAFDLEIGAFLWLPVENPHPPSSDGTDFNPKRVQLPAGCQVWVGTGLHLAMPDGYGLLVAPRSGWATTRGLTLANTPAVIDSDYRDEIKLALVNRSNHPITLERGNRIAQAWLLPAPAVLFTEGSVHDNGRGGFGSTGG